MSQQITALAKHSCAACGSQAEWNPAKAALVCPYCGTEAPGELEADSGAIREIPLVQTLRELPEALRGWKAEKRTVRCRSCDAVSVFDPDRVGQRCEFCGSPALVDYDEIKAPIRPQSLLPFKVSEGKVRESLRRWYASKWLAPGKLKKKALLDTVHGVYLPYWTFDAQVHCPWRADSGTYYYVQKEYRDRDGKAEIRRVRKTRWSAASGRIDHFFDDTPIPGTQGIDKSLLHGIEPFATTRDLLPYDTAYLSGFVVEHYRVVLFDAAQQARDRMERALTGLCGQQVPGDTYRNLRIDPQYSDQTFKHILVPVWLLSYDFRGRPYQIVVNGYSGKIAGCYPKSFWKIFFLVLFALAISAIFVIAGGR